MSRKSSENYEMTSVEFMQDAFREHIAPPEKGSKKERLRHAINRMMQRNEENRRRGRDYRWSENRVTACFNGDPRISPRADEIRDIEEMTGLRYAAQELRDIDDLIMAADALLAGPESDFYRPFVDAVRSMARAFDRSRDQDDGTPHA